MSNAMPQADQSTTIECKVCGCAKCDTQVLFDNFGRGYHCGVVYELGANDRITARGWDGKFYDTFVHYDGYAHHAHIERASLAKEAHRFSREADQKRLAKRQVV